MRRIIAASAALLAASLPSLAADMGGPPAVLRGTIPAETGIDWSGFYAGGTASYLNASLNRNNQQGQTEPLLSRLVRGSIVETGVNAMPLIDQGSYRTNRMGFGIFTGYNWTSEGAVFGVELDYTRASIENEISGARSGRVTGTDTPQTTYDWTAITSKRSKITDFGTIRARLGYAYGNFMPFFTGGVALGRSAETRSAGISGVQYLSSDGYCDFALSCGRTNYTPASINEGNRAKLNVGYTVGLGFEYAFTNNIFVRAEYQHIRFPDVSSTTMQINQARVGAGVKF
jgi:outer membrane immunogenic protein